MMTFPDILPIDFHKYVPNDNSPGAVLAGNITQARDKSPGLISGTLRGVTNTAIGAGTGAMIGSVGGPVGAALGAVIGGLVGVAKSLITESKKLVDIWTRLSKVSESLAKIYGEWNSKLSKLGSDFDLMHERVDRRWANAIEPLTTNIGKTGIKFEERWENIKISIFKTFEPLLKWMADKLGTLVDYALKIFELLSKILRSVVDGIRLTIALGQDLLSVPARSGDIGRGVSKVLGIPAPTSTLQNAPGGVVGKVTGASDLTNLAKVFQTAIGAAILEGAHIIGRMLGRPAPSVGVPSTQPTSPSASATPMPTSAVTSNGKPIQFASNDPNDAVAAAAEDAKQNKKPATTQPAPMRPVGGAAATHYDPGEVSGYIRIPTDSAAHDFLPNTIDVWNSIVDREREDLDRGATDLGIPSWGFNNKGRSWSPLRPTIRGPRIIKKSGPAPRPPRVPIMKPERGRALDPITHDMPSHVYIPNRNRKPATDEWARALEREAEIDLGTGQVAELDKKRGGKHRGGRTFASWLAAQSEEVKQRWYKAAREGVSPARFFHDEMKRQEDELNATTQAIGATQPSDIRANVGGSHTMDWFDRTHKQQWEMSPSNPKNQGSSANLIPTTRPSGASASASAADTGVHHRNTRPATPPKISVAPPPVTKPTEREQPTKPAERTPEAKAQRAPTTQPTTQPGTPAPTPTPNDRRMRTQTHEHGHPRRRDGDRDGDGNTLNINLQPSDEFAQAVMMAIAKLRGVLSAHDLDEMLLAYRLKNEGTYL